LLQTIFAMTMQSSKDVEIRQFFLTQHGIRLLLSQLMLSVAFCYWDQIEPNLPVPST